MQTPLVSVLLLATTLVAGCSPDRSRIDYDQVVTLGSLEVPPDLAKPINGGLDEEVPTAGSMSGDGLEGNGAYGPRVLPLGQHLHIGRDGDMRWLIVDLTPGQLWPRLREFWTAYGLALKVDSPAIAIMETDWERSKVDGPKGWFGAMSNSYDASKRDKFRIRLESTQEGVTELFLTHYGIEELATADDNDNLLTAWNPRPSDLEKANELLNHIIVFLGNKETTARAVMADSGETKSERAWIDGDQIAVSEGFARGWRRLGIALDRLGLVVDDRDRSRGIYYVSKVDQLADAGVERSWYKSAFASDKDTGKKYHILVKGGEQSSTVSMEYESGELIEEKRLQIFLKALVEKLN